jgi:subtilisin-like proprotein convertase family protein
LRVVDVAAGDVGTLVAWGLELCGNTVPNTPTPPPNPPATQPTATPKAGICTVYGYTGPAYAIPDNNPSGAEYPVIVPQPGILINDVNVRVDYLLHTYDSDLQIYLVAPDGYAILIADRVGGTSDHFVGTILDDQAVTPIANGTPPFSGLFKPDNPIAGQFVNRRMPGTWKLRVVDRAAGDTGAVYMWGLELCGLAPTPTPTTTPSATPSATPTYPPTPTPTHTPTPTNTPTPIVQTVPPSGGEVVVTTDKVVTLSIPAGGVPTDTIITIAHTGTLPISIGLKYVGHVFAITAYNPISGYLTILNPPFTLTVQYNDASVIDVFEDTVKLYYWDATGSAWSEITATTNISDNTVTAVLTHLTDFALIGQRKWTIWMPNVSKSGGP